jgi:predicted dithiol-disulfide oxidoreductase (DUF899 family)
MNKPTIVSREEWLAARKQLLVREKEFSRQRDALSAERHALPWVKIDQEYTFAGPDGRVALRDLFDGRRQLIVYHFMFDPSWDDGCKSCSFIAEDFDGAIPHLRARDVAFVAVSRAPLEKLQAFQKRMGWTFPWLSAGESTFNYDFHVSFTPEELAAGTAEYNYQRSKFPLRDAPGLSVFVRDGDEVFHAYSAYARGLDAQISTYNYLDLVPFGRGEDGLSYSMAWLRLHDRYDPS